MRKPAGIISTCEFIIFLKKLLSSDGYLWINSVYWSTAVYPEMGAVSPV